MSAGPLRAARHQTLIGLLAVTGVRPGEALALDRQDVDIRHGVVHVRAGKQKRQREVPLHESTIGAPGEYARQRDARFPTPSTSAFFISARGRRMARQELNQTFTKLIREVGLDSRGSGRSISITHRHIKNNRLANVGWMWAFSASSTCEPARRHYRQRREHGDRHAAATRHLFNKLLGQLHHCLQHQQTFDEAKAFPPRLCNAAA